MEPNAILLSLLTFFLGLLLGNWLAIGRDRRKERIDAAKDVRAILFDHLGHLTPYDRSPTVFEYDTLERLLPWWRRRRFRNAIERYQQSRKSAEKRDSVGGVFYSDTTTIKANLQRLIAFTNWR